MDMRTLLKALMALADENAYGLESRAAVLLAGTVAGNVAGMAAGWSVAAVVAVVAVVLYRAQR